MRTQSRPDQCDINLFFGKRNQITLEKFDHLSEELTNRNTRLPDHSLRVLQQDHWRKKTMNIPLSKVEEEMLKILRLNDKRYRRGLLQKIQEELKEDYDRIKK